MLRELVRLLTCLICSVFLVLLVPSSAWSDDTESPAPSPSSSPSDGASSPSAPTEPTPTGAPETTEPPTLPAEPSPSEETTTPPPTEPSQQVLTCTPDSPCVVEPSENTVALALLLGGVSTLALIGLFVRSFAG